MIQRRLSEIEDILTFSDQVFNSLEDCTEEEREAIKAFEARLEDVRGLHKKAQKLLNLFNSGFLNSVLNFGPKKNSKKRNLTIESGAGKPDAF